MISSISIWKPVIKKAVLWAFGGILDFGKTTYFKSSLSVLKKTKMGIKLSLIEKDQLIPLLDINPSDMKEDYVVRNQLQGRAGDDESFLKSSLSVQKYKCYYCPVVCTPIRTFNFCDLNRSFGLCDEQTTGVCRGAGSAENRRASCRKAKSNRRESSEI